MSVRERSMSQKATCLALAWVDIMTVSDQPFASVPTEAIWRVELRFLPLRRMGAEMVEAAAVWINFLRFIIEMGFENIASVLTFALNLLLLFWGLDLATLVTPFVSEVKAFFLPVGEGFVAG